MAEYGSYNVKAFKNKDKAEGTQAEMCQVLNVLGDALVEITNSLNELAKGDSEGDPYWNGPNAAKFFKSAQGNQTHNRQEYTRAFKRMRKFENTADSIASEASNG